MRFNRKTFFDGVRELFGSLNQSQVDGLEFLLGKFETDPAWRNLQQVAYVLATVDHESAHTFQPIKEFRARAGTPGRANQDRYWLSGFYGRGYVQVTWRKNYEKFGIADDPDKALEPETAYNILTEGMLAGLFTGKALGQYIDDDDADYVNARRVVNGLDRAEHIARVAEKFEAILKTAETGDIPTPVPHGPPDVHVEVEDKKDLHPDGSKSGEPVPDTPAQKGEAIVGGRPEDEPKQVTKGSTPTRVAIGSGVLSAIGSGVWAYIKGNPNVVVTALVCGTFLITLFVMRQVILDWARLQLGASPDKYNVK